jgi:hypothetical protein
MNLNSSFSSTHFHWRCHLSTPSTISKHSCVLSPRWRFSEMNDSELSPLNGKLNNEHNDVQQHRFDSTFSRVAEMMLKWSVDVKSLPPEMNLVILSSSWSSFRVWFQLKRSLEAGFSPMVFQQTFLDNSGGFNRFDRLDRLFQISGLKLSISKNAFHFIRIVWWISAMASDCIPGMTFWRQNPVRLSRKLLIELIPM